MQVEVSAGCTRLHGLQSKSHHMAVAVVQPGLISNAIKVKIGDI